MFLVFLLLVFPLCSPAADAATPEEEYQKVQEKIQTERKKLSETREKESAVLNEIEQVNRRLVTVEGDLLKAKRQLARTEKQIAQTSAEMNRTKVRLEKQKDWIRRKLRVMQRAGYSGDVVIALLGAKDVAQLMRFWKYLEHMTRQEHRILESYRENLAKLEEQQKVLAALREELRGTVDQVKTKEQELAEQRNAKEKFLNTVRHAKAEHQKMIVELRQASQRLLDLIRESAKTDTYAATGFPKLKGKLPWPVDGKVVVPYGTQRDPQFDTPVFRNGVHIQADPQSSAKSVYSGKIIFAEWFKGFGQLVIVNHGSGYHTLYGNLSEIFSRVGDIIKEQQMIGKVGMSGILNNPGLYFEIRYKGKPLDPAQWLTRKR